MDDREIIKLYNCRSEDALLETEKKYGKLVSFIIGRLIKNQLDVEECTRHLNMYHLYILQHLTDSLSVRC